MSLPICFHRGARLSIHWTSRDGQEGRTGCVHLLSSLEEHRLVTNTLYWEPELRLGENPLPHTHLLFVHQPLMSLERGHLL